MFKSTICKDCADYMHPCSETVDNMIFVCTTRLVLSVGLKSFFCINEGGSELLQCCLDIQVLSVDWNHSFVSYEFSYVILSEKSFNIFNMYIICINKFVRCLTYYMYHVIWIRSELYDALLLSKKDFLDCMNKCRVDLMKIDHFE